MKKVFPYIFSGSLLALVLSGSCRDEDFMPGSNPLAGEDAIRIGASIENAASTRTYIAQGEVTTGKFNLTYPYYYQPPDIYGNYHYLFHYGEVTFGYQGEETTGFVNVGTAKAPKNLVWSPTNNSSTDDGIFYTSYGLSPLILDNFNYLPLLSSNQVDTLVDMKNFSKHPYKASIFDSENGTNDLLWGKTREKTGNNFIYFDLFHRMTRLILNVVVEPNEYDDHPEMQNQTIILDNASVTLTQVLLEPLTYRRLYGDMLYQNRTGTNSVEDEISVPYQDFRMVRSEEDDNKDLEEYGKKYTWANTDEDPETGNKTYTTQDFVFAPQTLRQGTELRPKIVIGVPKWDVNNELFNEQYPNQDTIYFTGNVPVTMQMDNGTGLPPSLQTLNFDPGKVITLTTKMKPGEMELEFAPVTVEPWVYKGTFYPSAKQSGIYSAEDLNSLIDFYNEGNEFWMHKFGYIDSKGIWQFMINTGSLEFEAAKIIGRMIPGKPVPGADESFRTPDFNFDFRSRDEYYLMPDGTKITMGTLSTNLDNIVKTPGDVGIAEDTDFDKLISAYQGNFWQQLIYGTYDTESKAWVFRITKSIELDYTKIAASMLPRKPGDYTFKFEDGVTVKVSNQPGSTEPEVSPQELLEIVSNRVPGLYSEQEFLTLLSVIKNNEIAQLNQYGNYNEETYTWTFPLWRNFTIYAEKIQGTLYEPNPSDEDKYVFDSNGFELSLYQANGTTLKNPTPEQINILLKLQEPAGIGSEQDFYDMIDGYNDDFPSLEVLSQYGYYNISPASWIFFFTDAVTLNKETISGSMIPDEGDKLPFSFNLNYKQIKFEGEEGEGITGNNGATELLKIVQEAKDEPEPTPEPGTDSEGN